MMSHPLPVLEITATQTQIPVYRLRAALHHRSGGRTMLGREGGDFAVVGRQGHSFALIDHRGAAAALATDESARLREAPSWSTDLGLSWLQLCLVLLCGTVGVASGAFLAEQVLSGAMPKLASHTLAAPLLCLLQ